jgi:glycine C-acetyltransferase
MAHDRLDETLRSELDALTSSGTAKGAEKVITAVVGPQTGFGPRFLLGGENGEFLRMNSNSYLGLSRHPAVIDAKERASRDYGTGPGAVRFISGTYQPHIDLEARLAGFHDRAAAAVFSSAYAAVLSTLAALVTPETVVFSDELNHNCIINALRMTRPKSRQVYPHLDYESLDTALDEAAGSARRAIVVTDGVFSMRGDNADPSVIAGIAARHDGSYPENVVVVVDDSHGVGAFGETGRGTEEVSAGRCDILVGTLGKAFGVNGGYVTASAAVVEFVRERGPMYVYSNSITPGEAAAADTAVSILDSGEGRELLAHLGRMTAKFESGLVDAELETIPGPHPVVPLMVRDTTRTADLVDHLFRNRILATGLNYPVVPKGDEEIRFQINADHTPADIDFVLEVLTGF